MYMGICKTGGYGETGDIQNLFSLLNGKRKADLLYDTAGKNEYPPVRRYLSVDL